MILRSARVGVPSRAVVRAAGPIGHASTAQLPVAGRPPRRRRDRNLEPLSSSPQRPTVLDDAAGQLQPTTRGKTSISV